MFLPLMARLGIMAECLHLAKDHALAQYRATGIDVVALPDDSPDTLTGLLRQRWPDGICHGIFTSAVSFPDEDGGERGLWEFARAHGIPSVALLDTWRNYVLRFGAGPGQAPRPERLLVMDETAARAVREIGFAPNRVLVTGQPAFDGVCEFIAGVTADQRQAWRRRAGLPEQGLLVVIVSEPHLTGLNEIADEVAGAAAGLAAVAVRLHPKDASARVAAMHGIPCIAAELTLRETLAIADVVIGVTATPLVEAALAGLPVIVVPPPAPETILAPLADGVAMIAATGGPLAVGVRELLTLPAARARKATLSMPCPAAPHVCAAVQAMLTEPRTCA